MTAVVEYRRCIGCGVLIDAALVFCNDACGDLAFATSHECVFDPDGYCMVMVDGLPCGELRAWAPSGYVNAYRLQPYQPADVFERLTASDCWTNELNETARRTLSDVCWLVVGFVGLVAMVVIAGAAGGLS